MSNILQHNIERFGMVTVMDVVLYDINNDGTQGAPKLFLDTLKMTNISTEGSNKEIRGGIGNDMLISYDFGRTANIEIQDALLSPASLAVLFGTTTNTITEISHNVIVKKTADLPTPGTIKDGSLYVYPLDGTAAIEEGGDESDFPQSVTDPGVRILWIQTLTTAVAGQSEVTLTNDNFPIAMKLVGTSFVIEEKTGKKKRIQIEIPKFKINSNFAFTMDAEGDASVFDFNGVALVQNGELMKIQFLGDYDYDVNA